MESIASSPVKCSECSVWWRGMEHRCLTSDSSTLANYIRKTAEKNGVNYRDEKERYTNSLKFKRDGVW